MSGKQDMRTPKWLFDRLDKKFGPFVLDAAAEQHNALCDEFYSQHGEIEPWVDYTFCNPPFKNFGEWIGHACRQWQRHHFHSCLIGPVGCSQSWFHKYAIHGRVLVPNKRINFLLPDGTPTKSADRDTMIYLFGYGTGDVFGSFAVDPFNARQTCR